MSIYRSEAGKQALASVYTDAINQLEIDVETRQIETRFGSTHVLVAGPENGKPVVIFHGGNATNPVTLSWYTDLASDYRLIAPDTIGQPGKSAETRVDPQSDELGTWVGDLLDAFELQSAPMIGTSYGGGILLRAAAVAPDRIHRAVLVVPAGFGTGSIVSMMKVGLPAVLYRYFPYDWLLDYVIATMTTTPGSDPIVRDTIAASLRHVRLEREFPEAHAEELAGFTAPVALFVAEEDPFFPPDMVLPCARARLPNLSHTQVLRDENHMLSPAAQKIVTAFSREFFSE